MDYAFGWIAEPTQVEIVVSELPIQSFGQTEAGQVNSSQLPPTCYLWDAARKVTGGLLPPVSQGAVGSCVGFGSVRAIEYTMCAEIASGEAEKYQKLSEETLYAFSRVEVNGKRSPISGDGSIGAWAAKAAMQFGVLARGVYGSIDLSKYDEKRCREWGNKGVPNELEPTAIKHVCKSVTRVTTIDEAKLAISQGYAIAVSSDQGFSMTRDKDGYAKADTKWMHCMCVCGYHGNDFRVDNSWGGSAHTGPVGAGNPGPEGFWVRADVMSRMLSQKDSWAFSTFQGFPARRSNWIF